MIVLPPQLHELLRANALGSTQMPGFDPVPALKLFNPCGAATWLATELGEDNDTLFGLADLGFGCPELGYFSLSEITSIKLPFGLLIERDLGFGGIAPLSVWATVARTTGSLVAAEQQLRRPSRQPPPQPDPDEGRDALPLP